MSLSPRDRMQRIAGSAAALLAAAGHAGQAHGGAAAPQITVVGDSVVAGSLATARTKAPVSVRMYAMREAAARGWTGAHWRALEAIVRPESGWDPCAVYPRRHSCAYAGAESCGLPQAQPCPPAWRGRLWRVRFAQVRWLLDYIAERYGNPRGALGFRQAHSWY